MPFHNLNRNDMSTYSDNFLATNPSAQSLEIEFTIDSRIGIDGKNGISVTDARIDSRGDLKLTFSDGLIVNAGRALGKSGIEGIAEPTTVPASGTDAQLYLAVTPRVYANFKDRDGKPITLSASDTIAFFFRAGEDPVWTYTQLTLKMAQQQNKFSGKRIALFGDAAIAEYRAPAGTLSQLIRTKFDTSHVQLNGYAGCKFGAEGVVNTATLCEDSKLAGVVTFDPDLLLIMGGLHDYWHANTLGEHSGNIATTAYRKTTAGGLRYILSYFQSHLREDCRIILCTPQPSALGDETDNDPNERGFSMKNYVDRIKDIAEEFHIPVCNIWGEAGWSPVRELEKYRYTVDGINLTPEAYDRITDLQYRTVMFFQ